MKARDFAAPEGLRRVCACEGKAGFASFQLAAKVAQRGAGHRHESARVYRCEFCHRFHIGRERPKSARPIPARVLRLQDVEPLDADSTGGGEV